MKIANTTGGFGFYCKTNEERIRELHRAGFRYIDLNMYGFPPTSVYMQDGWQTEVARLKDVADELGMQFVQAHSPSGNPLWEDSARADYVVESTIRSIEICGMLGIKNTVSHAGMRYGIEKEEWFALNRDFYQKLIPTMERCGVNVLCENSAEGIIGTGLYYLYSGKDMREFIEYVGHPQFGGCWDTGHANVVGSQYDEIMAVGDKLWAIHYNDNRGTGDDHVMPFFGTMNHDEVLNALLDVGFSGYFTLEASDALLKYGKRRKFESAKRAPRLSDPQLFQQRQMEKLMYDTAKWMLESYDCFEE